MCLFNVFSIIHTKFKLSKNLALICLQTALPNSFGPPASATDGGNACLSCIASNQIFISIKIKRSGQRAGAALVARAPAKLRDIFLRFFSPVLCLPCLPNQHRPTRTCAPVVAQLMMEISFYDIFLGTRFAAPRRASR